MIFPGRVTGGSSGHSLHGNALVTVHRLDLVEQPALEDRLERAVVGPDVREGLSPDVVDASVAKQCRARMAAGVEAHQSHGRGSLCVLSSSMAKNLPNGRVRRAAKVGRLAGGQTARGYATKAANLTRGRGGSPRRRGAPPDGGGRADLRRARPDEGRRDEGRPGGLVHRHGRLPARVPGAHPGEARRAARLRAARVVQEACAR